MIQTCPNHLSKSPCELRFSRLLLPESHAQCVLIHTGTPDSQVRFGQKGCTSKTVVVEKGAFIRGPIRGQPIYSLSRKELAMSFWSEIAPLELALAVFINWCKPPDVYTLSVFVYSRVNASMAIKNMVQYTWFQDGFKSTKETLLGGLICFWLLDIAVLGCPCGVLQTSKSRSAGPQDPFRPVFFKIWTKSKPIPLEKPTSFSLKIPRTTTQL